MSQWTSIQERRTEHQSLISGEGQGFLWPFPPALQVTPAGWAALPAEVPLGGSRLHLGEKQY